MKKNKLHTVLSKLNDKETKEFKLFIDSPYFNKNKKLSLLYSYIIKYHPEFSHKNLEDSKVITHLDLKQSNASLALAKLNTQLFKLFELYIPVKAITEENKDVNILQFYSTHRLNSLFTNKWNSVQKQRKKLEVKGPNYFHEDFLLESLYNDFISSRAEKGEGDNNLKRRSEALDKYYFVNKLINACLKKNRQKSTRVDFDFTLLEEVKSVIEEKKLIKEPTFALWIEALRLIESPDNKELYDNLKELLLIDHSKVPSSEVKNLYVYLINSARHLFAQTDIYFSELFTIHKNMYDGGYLYHKSFIGATDLMNFVSISSRIGEFDYIEKFLNQNKEKIAPEYQEHEDVYELAKAVVAYYKKDYDHLLDILNGIKCVNIYRKLRERRLRLVAYYEGELNGLYDDLINSFRKYLSINKDNIPDFHLQANRDFVNIAQNLSKLRKSDSLKLKALKNDLDDIKTLPLRSWFLEKIEEKK